MIRHALLLVAFLPVTGNTQTENKVQSSARPFDLDIAGPVMQGGSDKRSAIFQEAALPELNAFLKATLGERKPFESSAYVLDPGKLFLRTESDVRVYFVGEEAGYRNTLGFNTGTYAEPAGAEVSDEARKAEERESKDSARNREKEKEKEQERAKEKSNTEDKGNEKGSGDDREGKATDSDRPYAIGKDGRLIFPDASSSVSSYDPATTASRSGAAPLLPGDFVDLGRFEAGTQLDFFLIANGAEGGSTTYSTQTSLNPDGLDHVVAFAFTLKDSPYLLLGFEDLYGGGDKDYNDLLFAIDIGAVNVTALTATPEPSTYLILGSLLGLGAVLKWRRDARNAVTTQAAA